MIIIGLTGGVASGKNFVADLFKRLSAHFSLAIFDADFCVHQIMSKNNLVLKQINKYFPQAIIAGTIDRKKLGDLVFADQKKLALLEKIIYPLLRKEQTKFIKQNHYQKRKMILLNIPLLFEKGYYKKCDKTIAVLSPQLIRKKRFIFRHRNDGLENRWQQITKNQFNDEKKKSRADYIIYNGLNKNFTALQVKKIFKILISKNKL